LNTAAFGVNDVGQQNVLDDAASEVGACSIGPTLVVGGAIRRGCKSRKGRLGLCRRRHLSLKCHDWRGEDCENGLKKSDGERKSDVGQKSDGGRKLDGGRKSDGGRKLDGERKLDGGRKLKGGSWKSLDDVWEG
jgi:hypothetical protein